MPGTFGYDHLLCPETQEAFPCCAHDGRMRVNDALGVRFDEVWLQENGLALDRQLEFQQRFGYECCQIVFVVRSASDRNARRGPIERWKDKVGSIAHMSLAHLAGAPTHFDCGPKAIDAQAVTRVSRKK